MASPPIQLPPVLKVLPCDDKHVCAIAGNAAMSPNAAADGCCSPAMHIGRVVDVHADNPAMIIAAVAHVAGVGRRIRSRSPAPVHRVLPAPEESNGIPL